MELGRKDGYLYTEKIEEIEEKILFQVMNAEKNGALLEQLPHEVHLDLALVYFIMEEEGCRRRIRLLDHRQMEKQGLSAGDLRKCAMENTPRLLPVSFHSMEEVLWQFQFPGQAGKGEKFAPMYVLTNIKMFLGASCIFYPKVLPAVGHALQDDFFILPSSIHECIILPMSSAFSKKELEMIVHEVNITQVPENEILSDHVYVYQRDFNEIKL